MSNASFGKTMENWNTKQKKYSEEAKSKLQTYVEAEFQVISNYKRKFVFRSFFRTEH